MNEKKILVYDKNQMSFLTFFLQEKIAENEYVSDFCSFFDQKKSGSSWIFVFVKFAVFFFVFYVFSYCLILV